MILKNPHIQRQYSINSSPFFIFIINKKIEVVFPFLLLGLLGFYKYNKFNLNLNV